MILITDDNSLHILGFAEGSDWKHYQYTHRDIRNTFFWLQAAYLQIKAEFDQASEQITPTAVAGLYLYGDAGYSRYFVRPSGELVLIASTTRPEKVATVKALGITVLDNAK